MNKLLNPRHAYPVAALDFARALGQVARWLPLSDEPTTVTRIPDDYIGINVAPAEDPAVDDYILDRLAEAKIHQVRMDFSYDSPGGPAQRLLERLLDADLRVMLDIFPPLNEARVLLDNTGAQQRWAEFLSETFSRYHQRVEWFEIGSTPNRGRWSGFSFLSYQAAWSIAIDRAAEFEIVLVGANVSDFEPFYNASFLAYMKRFGRSPDLHSDNLFVERVIEPEAYDHRVLGRLASNVLKLNLVKKARILALIGTDNGSAETVCTYKCWTSKRLERRSPWPDQKRVDYLVRYLALAASSDALRRVYWGPLICTRDGLISDQVEGYPKIDQVSYYQRIRGDLEDFVVTPGFAALGHTIQRIEGAQCLCLLHEPHGLSIYRFRKGDGSSISLCWCRDGMSWPLGQVFDRENLDKAQFYDGCGRSITRPAAISEQPLFIEFNDGECEPDLKNVDHFRSPGIIHLSSPTHQSITDAEDGWMGAGMLRSDSQLDDLKHLPLLRPSALPQLEETAVLRDARNRIWNVSDPRNVCGEISVKLNRVVGAKRFTYRFRPSKGRRHWNNACEMLRRGVNTPLPVAFYEQTEQAGIRDSWYLCVYIPGAFCARDVYAAFREGASDYRGLNKQAWFSCLSEFVCTMHNRQIVHRDLSAGNLLLRQREDGSVEPLVIDIGRVWLGKGSGLKQHHRLQDLIRICYKLDWQDREAFIRRYETFWGRKFSSWWRVPFHYYDNKQKFKKRLKGQRKKKRG